MTRYNKPLTLDQIAAIQDKDIDLSDIPELDGDFWQEAEVKFPDLTEQVTLRVKGSVLAHFKASGKGYQTRINQVLEGYVQESKRRARRQAQQDPAVKAIAEFQKFWQESAAAQIERAAAGEMQKFLKENGVATIESAVAAMAGEMQRLLKEGFVATMARRDAEAPEGVRRGHDGTCRRRGDAEEPTSMTRTRSHGPIIAVS